MEKKLTIIIVAYNSREILPSCLENILNPAFRIIIIDNASNDGTGEFINKNYPMVELISNKLNQGYGRAANIGLEMCDTPYCLLLNPDITTTSEIISQLLARTETYPDAAVIAPNTCENDKPACDLQVEWVLGAAMLFNMEKLKPVGFFDPAIFLYFEETDLCRRIRRQGLDIILCNNIYMQHLLGKSSAENSRVTYLKYWHVAWSRFYFNKKHYSFAVFLKKSSGYILKYSVGYLKATLRRNPSVKYKASLSGALSFVFGLSAFNSKNQPRGLN